MASRCCNARMTATPGSENGTGEGADEDQLGITDEEVDDLEDDAKGG